MAQDLTVERESFDAILAKLIASRPVSKAEISAKIRGTTYRPRPRPTNREKRKLRGGGA
jgi:hypothetical protein